VIINTLLPCFLIPLYVGSRLVRGSGGHPWLGAPPPGEVRIFPYDKAEQFNTIEVLKRLRVEFPNTPIRLVWDGAPYHRVQQVKDAAAGLEIDLKP